MKFHKQLFKHDPENFQYGDCMRTSLACLMDMDHPEQIPNFMYGNPSGEDFWNHVHSWLADNGLALVTIHFDCSLDALFKTMALTNPNMYYLLAGMSPRGFDHQVIGLNDKIIHDPHPDNSGLTGPCGDNMFYVSFLVPKFHRANTEERAA